MKKRTDFRSYRFEKRKKHSDNGNTRWSFGPQNLWSQRVQGRKGGDGKGKLRVQTWCADKTLGDQGHWKWDQGRLSCWTNHSRRMTGVEVRSKTISQSFHRGGNRGQRWWGTFSRSYSDLGIEAGIWSQLYLTSEPGSNYYSTVESVSSASGDGSLSCFCLFSCTRPPHANDWMGYPSHLPPSSLNPAFFPL